MMNVLKFIEPGRLAWREAASLHVNGELEAIVRPIASTTCDLDRRIIRGAVDFGRDFPIGHECVAEVLDVGDSVASVRPGDLVVVPRHICCGVCANCRVGLTAACTASPGMSGYGAPIAGDWGGLFSEEVRVPFADGMLTRLPDGIDPVFAASASDNMTDAYIAVWRGLSKHPGAPVLVVNSLPSLGLFVVDLARAAGAASVDFVDVQEDRREIARGLGAAVHPAILPEHHHWKFPVVINVAAQPELLADAFKCLAPGGHLSNAAMFFQDTPLPLWELYKRDVTFSMGTASINVHLPRIFDLLKCGHVHPERIMTTYGMDNAPEILTQRDLKPVLTRPRLLNH